VFRIENVATKPTLRITANDEERQRQGFELQTTFEWALRGGFSDIREAVSRDDQGDIVHLVYGAGATITRLNLGLRRRRDRTELGFMIDPVSGYWRKVEDEPDGEPDPTASPRQRIVPAVQDHKNALLLRPSTELEEQDHATLQHALLRGIETVFQLEQSEVLAEPMPTREVRRGILVYEATEGGAGVLSRLCAEPARLREVATMALAILHLDVGSALPANSASLGDVADTQCVAACYRCVMSYYNQPDHELLDRRRPAVREFLLRLARGQLVENAAPGERTAAIATDDIGATWPAFAASQSLPQPDSAPLPEHEAAFVWRDHFVMAWLEEPLPAQRDRAIAQGFEVVVVGKTAEEWRASAVLLAKLLGSSA
jgi:hypothetical protein